MLGVFAEFEHAMIREPVQAGIDRARAAGTRLGRPKIDGRIAEATCASLANGVRIRRAAKLRGVGVSTVQRLKAVSSDLASGEPPGARPFLSCNPTAGRPTQNPAAAGTEDRDRPVWIASAYQ
jgi:hypothetical protein